MRARFVSWVIWVFTAALSAACAAPPANEAVRETRGQIMDPNTGLPLPPSTSTTNAGAVTNYAPLRLRLLGNDGTPLTDREGIAFFKDQNGSESMGPTSIAQGILTYPVTGSGECLLYFRGLGYTSFPVTTSSERAHTNPITLRLRKGATVRGRVFNPDRKIALGGVAVLPHRQAEAGGLNPAWNLYADMLSRMSVPVVSPDFVSRDGDGVYELANLPPGKYTLRVVGVDVNARPQDRELVLTDDQIIDALDFIAPLPPNPGTLLGRVLLDNGGVPVANQAITLIFSQGELPVALIFGRRVVTDGDGRFRLFPVKRGTLAVTASHRRSSETRTVKLETNQTVQVTFRLK